MSSAVRQIGAGLKPTHHVVAVDGVREAFPSTKLSLRIRDAFQHQLLVRDQMQRHTQSRGDDLSVGGNNNKGIPQLRDVDPLPLQDSEAMPADNTPPIRKRLAAEAEGCPSDPINLAIAREVLRRVREGESPIAIKNADSGP